ncbi:tetratricopeptide repeat protein [Pseudooceanicola onchidii]|uniref:tetratricopeptide repeat protein n=1 Tax=Pseudooceanicola onchidii TaxID=2562279 RepID=UPI0010A9AFE6|nr:tetratricopeptide repeat protein [Pseudooceanicola onchidii]
MKKFVIAISLVLALAACDTAEERAENHYQTALSLLEEGDVPRALIELRNVFNLNGQHQEARRLYAQTVLEQGKAQEAFGQFRLLVEQYPDDIEGNRALARLAMEAGQIEQAKPYIARVLEAEPDNTEMQSMDALVAYATSRASNEQEARTAALAKARKLIEADPELIYARQVVLTQLMQDRDWPEVRREVEAALEVQPEAQQLYRLRLAALEQMGETEELEKTLIEMTRRFSDDPATGQMLIRWYLSRGEIDKAEDWLRDRIDPQTPNPQARLVLLEFLTRFRSEQAALDEITELMSQTPMPADIAANEGTFTALRAGLMFNMGEQKAAMLRLEELVETGEPGEELDRVKISLAQMREQTGNNVGARALVEEVLERDRTNVGALKMKAAWLIDGDETSEAINTLREALDQEPNDTATLTLLARAYEREGSRELMTDMLSRAVDASGRAPGPSIQLAKSLIQNGQFRSAEDVLIEALRVDSANVQLLHTLGQVHIGMDDWGRVDQDIKRLRALDSPQSKGAADDLEAKLLLNQRKTDDLIGFVESLSEGDRNGEANVIRALVMSGQVDQALERAKSYYEDDPEAPAARFLYASALSYSGQDDQALELFQALAEEEPKALSVWRSIYSIQMRNKQMEAAAETVEKVNAALPDNLDAKWMKAGHYEALGQPEEAIAVYEEMYAQNSNLPVIANNLASLLSTVRDDPESLERAYTVARRLRQLDVPAFKDTYGWIALRRGEIEEAEAHLVPAAEALSNDPSVQYHVGALYAEQEKTADAREAFERALQLLEEGGKTYPGLVDVVTEKLAALPEGEAQTGQ